MLNFTELNNRLQAVLTPIHSSPLFNLGGPTATGVLPENSSSGAPEDTAAWTGLTETQLTEQQTNGQNTLQQNNRYYTGHSGARQLH